MTITDATVLDPRINWQLAVNVDAAEADRLTAYLDSLGNWTIGRGHLLPPAAPGRTWAGFTIIQSTSDRYFNGDLLSALTNAQKLPEWAKCDTQARQDGLTEICFNMGIPRWEKFKRTRDAISQQLWQVAHDGLLWNSPGIKTPWYAEVGVRAERIANQFLRGEYV